MANFWTTHKEYLVVFITVQNLVRIASVILIIQNGIFCTIGLKTPIRACLGCLSGKNRGNGYFLHFYTSRNAISRN